MSFELFLDSGERILMAQQLKHMILTAVFLLASAALPLTSSSAQETEAEPSLPTRTGQYLSDAITIARVLGRAHSIRVTCNGRDDQFWRLYMQEMLDIEAPIQGQLRDSMARAFNDAFEAEAAFRVRCDEEAVAAEAEYAQEGRVIAEKLAQYYFKRQ